jgi:hypothetical protein
LENSGRFFTVFPRFNPILPSKLLSASRYAAHDRPLKIAAAERIPKTAVYGDTKFPKIRLAGRSDGVPVMLAKSFAVTEDVGNSARFEAVPRIVK